MQQSNQLAERFEENRARLHALAFRMLGSPSEAEDAVQEAWLRLSRSDAATIENLSGWLTTVVGRVCLDLLRSRTSRREEPLDAPDAPGVAIADHEDGPEQAALLGDAVGMAMLVVLDRLAPAERVAFVLHDVFGVSFEEIAPIVDRSPTATRQLASRARRRVRGADPNGRSDRERQRAVVEAFLAAAKEGNFGALLRLLDPAVVLRADRVAVAAAQANAARGAPALAAEKRGAETVASVFVGGIQVAQPALIDGAAGAVWAMNGKPRAAFRFTIVGDRVTAIELVADPKTIRALDITPLST